MSDYEDDSYADESFEDTSPVKAKNPPPHSPPQSPGPASPPRDVEEQSSSKSSRKSSRKSSPASTPRQRSNSSHSNDSRNSSRKQSGTAELVAQSSATAAAASPETDINSHRGRGPSNSQSVEPTPRDFNWLRPTPKTPPVTQGQSQPPSRQHQSPPASRSPSRSASPASSRSRSSNSSHYSSPFSSAAPSPQKDVSTHGVPHLPPVKPTSAPAQASHRTSSSRDSGHRSNPEPRSPPPKKVSKKQQEAPPPAKPSNTGGFQALQEPTSVQEINLLRLKNAELQRAIDDARSQLYKLAPRMSVFKVKRRTDEERLKKLQSEAQVLAQDYEVLNRRAREANHVKMLEKNIVAREEEIKKLTERNKYLQVEIRNNTRRLKHNENIDEQRKNLLGGLRNERVIAQGNLERAKKEAESASHSRESLAQRLSELEAKDKLRDMPIEDVKRIIELRTTLTERDDAIANMLHRLQILKRAADSSATAKSAAGIPAQGASTANDLTAIELLKEEIASMRFKLDAYAAQTADTATTSAVAARRQAAKDQQAAAQPAAAAPVHESPQRESWAQQGKSKPSAPAAGKKLAAAARRTNSAEPAAPAAVAAGSGAAAAKKGGPAGAKGKNEAAALPPRSESVPPMASTDIKSDDDTDGVTKKQPGIKGSAASSSSLPAKKQSKAAIAIADVHRTEPEPSTTSPAKPDDDTPPWMMDEVTPKKSEKALKQLSASSSLTRDPTNVSSRVSPTARVISPTSRVSPTRVSPTSSTLSKSDSQPAWLAGRTSPTDKASASATAAPASSSATPLVASRAVSPPPPSEAPEAAPAAAAAPPPPPAAEAPKKSEEPAWLFDD